MVSLGVNESVLVAVRDRSGRGKVGERERESARARACV